jgi:hypothetical protein
MQEFLGMYSLHSHRAFFLKFHMIFDKYMLFLGTPIVPFARSTRVCYTYVYIIRLFVLQFSISNNSL